MDIRNPMIYTDVEEDWLVTDKQEKIIADICIDARHWYQTLPLEMRFNRLNKTSYVANLIRRYTVKPV